MRSKPGARGGASNHHGPVTGQMEADTKNPPKKQTSIAVLVRVAWK